MLVIDPVLHTRYVSFLANPKIIYVKMAYMTMGKGKENL